MRNNKQYLMVGSFVLLAITIIVGIWLWFSAANRRAYDIYRIVFHEPVDGVTTNSVVKFNGVEVGKVNAISIDAHDPSSIYVDINILQGTQIPDTTFARIKAQGVTGMSFINLSLPRSEKYNIIKPHNKPPYPEILSKPSLLANLVEQAQTVATNIEDVSVQLKVLLDNKNINHVSNIVANLDKFSTVLAKQSDRIEHSVVLFEQVLNNINHNTQNLNGALIELTGLSKALHKNSDSLGQVLDTVQNDTLRNINTVFLPNLNQTITNMSRTTAQVDELMRTINQNPSVLVRGKAPAKPGPGE